MARTEIIPYELDAVDTAVRNLLKRPPAGSFKIRFSSPPLSVWFFYEIKLFLYMKVEINHKEIEVADGCSKLSELLAAEGFTGVGQAVAVNNRVVPKADWPTFELADGMSITIIRAVCGG